MRVKKRVQMSRPLMVEVPKEDETPIRHRNEIQVMLEEAIERRDAWILLGQRYQVHLPMETKRRGTRP